MYNENYKYICTIDKSSIFIFISYPILSLKNNGFVYAANIEEAEKNIISFANHNVDNSEEYDFDKLQMIHFIRISNIIPSYKSELKALEITENIKKELTNIIYSEGKDIDGDFVRYQGSLFYVNIQHNSFKRFDQDKFKTILNE